MAWKMSVFKIVEGNEVLVKSVYIKRKRELNKKAWKKVNKDLFFVESKSSGVVLKIVFEVAEPIYRNQVELFISLSPDEREFLKSLRELKRTRGISWRTKKSETRTNVNKSRKRKMSARWIRRTKTITSEDVEKMVSELRMYISEVSISDYWLDFFADVLLKIYGYDKETFWNVVAELGARDYEFMEYAIMEMVDKMKWTPYGIKKSDLKMSMIQHFSRRVFSYVNGEVDGITIASIYKDVERENYWSQMVYGDRKW